MKRASKAQAKLLANLWSERGCTYGIMMISVDGYNEPTALVLVERGWLVSTNRVGTYPSGAAYEEHVISRAGIVALRDYLTKALSDG
jgi:hypothetical protein